MPSVWDVCMGHVSGASRASGAGRGAWGAGGALRSHAVGGLVRRPCDDVTMASSAPCARQAPASPPSVGHPHSSSQSCCHVPTTASPHSSSQIKCQVPRCVASQHNTTSVHPPHAGARRTPGAPARSASLGGRSREARAACAAPRAAATGTAGWGTAPRGAAPPPASTPSPTGRRTSPPATTTRYRTMTKGCCSREVLL